MPGRCPAFGGWNDPTWRVERAQPDRLCILVELEHDRAARPAAVERARVDRVRVEAEPIATAAEKVLYFVLSPDVLVSKT